MQPLSMRKYDPADGPRDIAQLPATQMRCGTGTWQNTVCNNRHHPLFVSVARPKISKTDFCLSPDHQHGTLHWSRGTMHTHQCPGQQDEGQQQPRAVLPRDHATARQRFESRARRPLATKQPLDCTHLTQPTDLGVHCLKIGAKRNEGVPYRFSFR